MKPFHLLMHACDNHGVDEWEIEISKVLRSYAEKDVLATVAWLTDNMELYPSKSGAVSSDMTLRLSWNETPVRAVDVFTKEDLRTVRALYCGVIRGCRFCGATKSDDRFERTQVALDSAEFAFLFLHPDLNSYESFYRPIKNVVEYMKTYNDRLEAETERIYNENH